MIESFLQIAEPVKPVVRNNSSSVQWIATTSLNNGDLWLHQAQKKLHSLAELLENWDDYGSLPIQPAALEKAGDLVSLLSRLKSPQPEIFPVPGGGLQLELRNQQHEVEIEILPDGNIEYLIVDTERQMKEGVILPGSMAEVYRLIHWFKKDCSTVVEFDFS